MHVGIPSRSKRRSRRLRKKLRIAEFKEEGFEINFRFKPGMSSEQQLDLLMRFITEVVEARGLAFGGGENGFVTREGRGSTTDADREAVGSWLNSCESIHLVEVGSLQDAWYGWAASVA
jgi:uncharacterized protein YggL (DUF469 family)